MPQLSPMSWTLLFTFAFFFVLSFSMSSKSNKSVDSKSIKVLQMKWSW